MEFRAHNLFILNSMCILGRIHTSPLFPCAYMQVKYAGHICDVQCTDAEGISCAMRMWYLVCSRGKSHLISMHISPLMSHHLKSSSAHSAQPLEILLCIAQLCLSCSWVLYMTLMSSFILQSQLSSYPIFRPVTKSPCLFMS